jgi:hypothetical protein
VTRKNLKTFENELCDMEHAEHLENSNTLTDEKSYSGKRSCKLTAQNEFSVVIKKNIAEYADLNKLDKIKIKAMFNSDKANHNADFVLSIEFQNGKSYYWEGHPVTFQKQPDTWSTWETDFNVNTLNPDTACLIKMYVWNKGKTTFYLDDLEINYQKK